MKEEKASHACLDEQKEKEYLRKIEAALFISGKFLSIKELVALTNINPVLLHGLLEKLVEKYEDSAIKIVKKGELWKMDVSEEHTDMVNTLATGSAEFSKAEQETLAVIAYKQPIKQSIVIKIRGNKAYEHVRKFIEAGLLRAKKSGRTKELSLSDEFYDYFKLDRETDLKLIKE